MVTVGERGGKKRYKVEIGFVGHLLSLSPSGEGKRRGRKVQAPRRGRRISRAGSREGRRRREGWGKEEREIG